MRTRVLSILSAVGAAVLMLSSPALAAPAGPVSTTPANFTPRLATSGIDGSVEQIRQLVPCGSNMYAVGTFSQIKRYSTVYTRNNAFSFSATTGAMTAWNPNVNGLVNSVALSADCGTAYLGGVFTSVNGTAVRNIAAVSTSTGAVVPGFASSAGGQVSAMLMSGSHLLVGGYFTSINNSAKGYLVSLNPRTGLDDNYVNLNISGTYVYRDDNNNASGSNATRIYNFSLSPDGTRLLAMGVFTSISGKSRRQIAMLNLGATGVTVNDWYSPEFDANCAVVQPFYVRDASWAPSGQALYVATTGYKPANGLGFRTSDPRAGLCDAAVAFPTTPTLVGHSWINYTGCDSLYSTAADANTVYVGGHERYASNASQCDNNNNGTAVEAPGMVGLSSADGRVIYNPTRGRGYGADDMVVTGAGLWIASDNAQNTDDCGRQYGHSGLCFFPY